MAVKKQMNTSVENFIDKGAGVKATKGSGFKNILIRVPVAILNEMDRKLSEKPWINRTQWIVESIHEKLNKGG
jgi:hypothetical protein